MPKIIQHIRSKTGPRGLQYWDRLGSVLVAVEDPDGEDIPEDAYKGIWLPPDRHLIRNDDWNAWLNLCIHMLGKVDADIKSPDSGQEVSCAFMLPPKEQQIEIWIQTQKTGAASVDIDYTKPLRHIITGVEMPSLADMEQEGYIKMGGAHSHNTMGAFFSSTDDRNEKPQPGYHFVVGNFHQKDNRWWYNHALSITLSNRRFEKFVTDQGLTEFDLEHFVADPKSVDVPFHKDVMDLVDFHRPAIVLPGPGSGWTGMGDDLGSYGRRHGGQRAPICWQPNCWGDVLYYGVCTECGVYNELQDRRTEGEKNLDKAYRPFYDEKGDLVGYIYPGKMQSTMIGGSDLRRLRILNKWPEKSTPTVADGLYFIPKYDDKKDTPPPSLPEPKTITGKTLQRNNRIAPWHQRPKRDYDYLVDQGVKDLDLMDIEAPTKDIEGALNIMHRIMDWATDVDKSHGAKLVSALFQIVEDSLTYCDLKDLDGESHDR